MTFYRGRYDDGYKIGAKLQVLSYKFKSIVKQTKQGGAVEYAGQIASTEAIQRGAHIIADDAGQMTAYEVEPISGMSAVKQYLLKEAGIL